MKIKQNQKGFTLVELLVVITIMGVLGTVLVANYAKYVEKSKQVVVDEQLNEITQAFELGFIDGISYNENNYTSFNDIHAKNTNVKELYENIAGGNLPAGSTLTIDDKSLTYTFNGKTAKYNYA